MIINYYYALFILSCLCSIILAVRERTRTDASFAIFFVMVPVDIFGYITIATAKNVETAIVGNNLVYLGGCFLPLFFLLVICNLCGIVPKPYLKAILFFLSLTVFTSTLTIGKSDLFYRNVSLAQVNGATILVKDYGPLHKYFYILIIMYMIGSIINLVYAYLRKPEASIKTIYLLTMLMVITVFAFFGGRAITKNIEFVPASYLVTEIILLLISHRIKMYNITGNISDTVLKNGADGLICFDMKRKLLVTNETAQNMIPGLKQCRTDHLLDTSNPTFNDLYQQIDRFKNNIPSLSDVVNIGHSYYRCTTEYIMDKTRKMGYYIVLRDVTSEHNYLESISKYNIQIKEAAKAAIAADDAKTRFLAQMSHEIRTPINAILGLNEMIMHESKDDNILNYSNGISSSGRTLLFLINSILDFSKIEDGKMEIINAKYDTLSLIDTAMTSAVQTADTKGLVFETDIDETIPSSMIGDDVRIIQVIVNLLSNAVKYTEKGSVRLSIKRSKDLPDNDTSKIKLHVEVKDTGIGIKPEDLDRLFISFERLDETRNRHVEGTGLGMSIVRKLLEMMGSKINVESTYGKGSRFWFDIDQEIADPKPIGDFKTGMQKKNKTSEEEAKFSAPNAKILLVDDNPMNLKVARSFLKTCDIVPDEATSGKETIELMRNKKYDIVFLDHMMPEMDGIETLKELRRESLITYETAMIVFTANAIEGSRDYYMNAGFDDYISKPVELKTMLAMVRKYIK